MSQRPVALFVTPVLPLPGGSGRALRAWDWLQSLSADYRVHLLVADGRDSWPELPADYPAEALWSLSDCVATTRGVPRLAGVWLPWLARFSRRFVSDWQRWVSPALPDALQARLAGQEVARILVFRLYLQALGEGLAARFPQARCELDLDDLESQTRRSVALACWRMGHYREALRGLAIAVQYRLVERSLARGYQRFYLAAPDDARQLPVQVGQAITCRPNRIGLPAEITPLPSGDELGLLFVGTLNYPPNEEAVRFLLGQLLPLLRNQLTMPWRLRVVGRAASSALQALLQREPQVEFLGDSEDLAGCYARSQVVLVPLFAGGGTKLKTLEAFAHGRALVASDEGVRGLQATAGEHYLLANGGTEFAAAIIALATQPPLAARIASAGRHLCQQRFARP